MAVMRLIAAWVAAAVLATGCTTNTYKIPRGELQRISMLPPEQHGERVRVQQELGEADVGPPQPVTAETEIVFFPQINVYGPYERHRYYRSGSTWGSWSGGSRPSGKSGLNLNLGGGGGGGGDKGAAIAILVIAAVALFAVVAVEGSRFDGYARLHPMHPVYLVGRDGGRTVLPLAWIDPQTASWAKHGFVRRNEGPWQELERAPLDREGWNFSMYGGVGIYSGIDGSRGSGPASTIQLGYFPVHQFGIVGSLFMGWRENEVGTTNFHARYGLEGQIYPVSSGFLQLGGYVGLGGAYRSDERFIDGYVVDHKSDTDSMLSGGVILQLDINTRIALTGRFGIADTFGEKTAESIFGLSVY
jgi:hypothetical protein